MAKQKKAKAAAKPSAKLAKLIEKPVAPMATPLRLEYRTASELASNPQNWRVHSQRQLDALRDVIADVGWAGVCLFNEATGRLIDGHARKAIAGNEQVHVLIGSWSEAQERQILATLDPLGAMAGADKDRLDALLREVQTGSESVAKMLEDVGRRAGCEWANERDAARAAELDEVPDAPAAKDVVTKTGDLWILGESRLLCGDSTNAEDVRRLFNGEKAGLCFTSPPYAQQREYTKKIGDWDGLMQGVFGNLDTVMEDAGQVLVNLGLVHRDGEWLPYWDGWIEWMRGRGWRRFGWYVWDQGPGLPGDWAGRLAPSHEFVFHFNRQAAKPEKTRPCKHAGEVQSSRTFRNGDGTLDGFTHAGHAVQSHAIMDSVVRVMRLKGGTKEHPAAFPVGLAEAVMLCWPATVFDPFAGSGTTLIAAHQLNRRCFGLELAPQYVDVAVQRWESLTGQKAKLQRGA